MAENNNNEKLQQPPKVETLPIVVEQLPKKETPEAITDKRQAFEKVLSAVSERYSELQNTIAPYIEQLKEAGNNIKDQLNVLKEIKRAFGRLSLPAYLSLMFAIAPFLLKAGIGGGEGGKDGIKITVAPTEETKDASILEQVKEGNYQNVGELEEDNITIIGDHFSLKDASDFADFKGNNVTIKGKGITADAMKQLTQNLNSKLFHTAQEIAKENLAKYEKEVRDHMSEDQAEAMIQTFKTQNKDFMKDVMNSDLGESYTFNTDITSPEYTSHFKDLKVKSLNIILKTYASEHGPSKNDPKLAAIVAKNIMQCPASYKSIRLQEPVSDAAYKEYFMNNNTPSFNIYAPNLSTKASSYVQFCNTENLTIQGTTLDSAKAANIVSQLMERDTSGNIVPQLDKDGNLQYRKSLNLYFAHYEPGAIKALMKFPNKLTINITEKLTAAETKDVLKELKNYPAGLTLNLKQLYMSSLQGITPIVGMTINVSETIGMKAKEYLESFHVKVGGNTKNLYIDANTIYEYSSEESKKAMDEYNAKRAIEHEKDKQDPDFLLGSK